MANRWTDGFGRYGGNIAYMLNGSSGQAWAEATSGMISLENDNPRTGLWHARLTSGFGDGRLRRVFGEPLTEVFLGKAIYAWSLPISELGDDGANPAIHLFSIRDQANAVQLSVILGTDGALEVRRGISTVLDRTIPVIGAGAYQHIELYAKASNSVGAIEIRVDEVTRLNLTGIDTVATSNVEFSQDAISETGLGTAGSVVDIADYYCNDTVDDGSGCNTFLGDCKSVLLLANADTAQADFALSAGGSGYPLIGQAPPDDSTYISRTATTGRSDFGLQNGPGNLTEVLTARPFIRGMKDDAGTASIAPSIISGGDKAAVTPQPLTTAFAYYDSNVPVDPDTGVPWTPDGLNAAGVVVERTA